MFFSYLFFFIFIIYHLIKFKKKYDDDKKIADLNISSLNFIIFKLISFLLFIITIFILSNRLLIICFIW